MRVRNILNNFKVNRHYHVSPHVFCKKTTPFLEYKELEAESKGSILHLYGFPISQPTRAILHLCKQNNIKYQYHDIDVFVKQEQRKPEFRKINPAGLVPCLRIEHLNQEKDFVVSESAACLQYIAETNRLSKWYPVNGKNAKLRAKIHFWLHWK